MLKQLLANRRLYGGIVAQFVEQVIALLVGLYVVGVISRYLGVAEYGGFQYSLSVIFVFMAMTWLCGAEVLVPLLSSDLSREQKSKYAIHVFLIRVVVCAIVYVGFLIFAWHSKSAFLIKYSVLLGLPILLQESLGVGLAWLQAEFESYIKSIVNIVINLMRALIFYAIVNVENVYNTWIYLAVYMSGMIFTPAFLMIYAYRKFYIPGARLEFGLVRELLSVSWIFLFSLVFQTLFARVDRLVLIYFMDGVEFGNYNAALQLNDILNGFVATLIAVVAPAVYKLQGDQRKVVFGLGLAVFLVMFMFSFILSYFSELIILLVFGDGFLDAAVIFSVSVYISAFYAASLAMGLYFIARQRPTLLLVKWAIFSLLAVLGFVFVVPTYGAWGALGVMISVWLLVLCYDIYWLKTARI